MGKWLLVVLVVAVMVSSGLAYGQTTDQPYPGDRAGQVVGPAPGGGSAPEMAPPPVEASPQPAYSPTYQPRSEPQEVRLGGELNVRLVQEQPKVVYRDRWRTKTVAKTVPTPASTTPAPTTPVFVNVVSPASSPAPAVTPPPSGGPTPSTPAGKPREEKTNVNWWILVAIAAVVGPVVGWIVTVQQNRQIQTSNALTAQGANNNIAMTMATLGGYVPAQGRKVGFTATFLPGGGGIVRADADERPQGTVVQPVVPPVQALVVTPAGGPVNVITLGAGQPPVARPGQLGLDAPAPPQPAAAPAAQPEAIDPAAAAAAGANA